MPAVGTRLAVYTYEESPLLSFIESISEVARKPIRIYGIARLTFRGLRAPKGIGSPEDDLSSVSVVVPRLLAPIVLKT